MNPTPPAASAPASPDSPGSRRALVIVDTEDAGERADVVLGRRVPALSRRQARALAHAGGLRIDGHRAPPSTRVEAGARLEIDLAATEPDPPAPALQAQLDALQPLAISDDFLYVRKPAGVHTVALTPDQPGVLATAVAARWPECAAASADPREGGAVHRLDQPTSGVVAFARNADAWSRARQGFADERVAKHYLAVGRAAPALPWPPPTPAGGLHGWLEPAEALTGFATELAAIDPAASTPSLSPIRVRAPLGRGSATNRGAVRLDGRRASTVISPLANRGPHWLLRLGLETGRRHQARIHLAWIGLPILGDDLYGDDLYGDLYGDEPGATSPPRDETREGAGEAAPAIHLHAFAIDLSALFPRERAVFAAPPPGFWPPS